MVALARRVLCAAAACLALPTVPAADLLIQNVTLIDGTGRPPVAGASVLVRDGRIAAITHTPPDADVERVEGAGRFLIPGLFDVHVHVPGGGAQAAGFDPAAGIRSLHSFLYSGVTAVYDAGNNAEYIMRLRSLERDNKIASPRIFATGANVTYPGSWGASPTAILVSEWPAGAAALDENFARGPDLQKITYENFGVGANPWVPSFPEELFTQIIAYCKAEGFRTTVHVSDEIHARLALAAGAETLAHPVVVGRMSDGFVETLAQSGVIVATTLAVFDDIARIVEDPSFLDAPAFRAVWDHDTIDMLRTTGRERYTRMGWGGWFRTILPFAQENVKRIHDAGGILALGTDRNIGPLTHRELELLVDAGIEPHDAIRIATLNAAAYLGVADRLGSLEVGKEADMVLLNADPTVDIRNAREIEAVFKRGRRIDRQALDLPVNR